MILHQEVFRTLHDQDVFRMPHRDVLKILHQDCSRRHITTCSGHFMTPVLEVTRSGRIQKVTSGHLQDITSGNICPHEDINVSSCTCSGKLCWVSGRCESGLTVLTSPPPHTCVTATRRGHSPYHKSGTN